MFDTQGLGAYTRYPERLKALRPELSAIEKPDVFGVLPRLDVIKKLWPAHCGSAIDLGGNSGFFSLSLIDAGVLSSSTVYDVDEKALDAGRQMAEIMGLASRVKFVKQEISLDWLGSLDKVDNILCLNLIHHAGTVFDVERVQALGWEAYANAWLKHMRGLAGRCALGVGFKRNKPTGWAVPAEERPARIRNMAAAAGWKLAYDANVEDLVQYGADRANGMRKGGRGLLSGLTEQIGRKIEALAGRGQPKQFKRERYHLFVLE